MKKIVLIGAVILAATMVACKGGGKSNNQSNTRSTEVAEWKTLEQDGYRIQYPDSLELTNPGAMGTSFALFFSLTSSADTFRENINLVVQDLKGLGVSLDQYVEISEEQVKTLITDGNLIESKRLKKDGTAYQKLVYTGRQGQFSLEFEQYLIIKNEKAYIVTFTAEADQFDNYKKVAEEVMDTFSIK